VKYLAVVANLSLSDQDLTVSLDSEIAGYKVLDAEKKEAVEANGGKFNVSIPRRNFKIFLINK